MVWRVCWERTLRYAQPLSVPLTFDSVCDKEYQGGGSRESPRQSGTGKFSQHDHSYQVIGNSQLAARYVQVQITVSCVLNTITALKHHLSGLGSFLSITTGYQASSGEPCTIIPSLAWQLDTYKYRFPVYSVYPHYPSLLLKLIRKTKCWASYPSFQISSHHCSRNSQIIFLSIFCHSLLSSEDHFSSSSIESSFELSLSIRSTLKLHVYPYM